MISGNAAVPAPALRIKLRESGGVRGRELTMALEGNLLRVTDRGQIRVERHVPNNAVLAIAAQVKALEDIQPRRSYGNFAYTSDILTTELQVSGDSEGLEVEVVSDPRDPAPRQFWEVVENLRSLVSTGSLAMASER